MTTPITIERAFKVDGRRLLVRVTFPAPVVEEVGGEQLLVAANRAIVTLDTKKHEVQDVRLET